MLRSPQYHTPVRYIRPQISKFKEKIELNNAHYDLVAVDVERTLKINKSFWNSKRIFWVYAFSFGC